VSVVKSLIRSQWVPGRRRFVGLAGAAVALGGGLGSLGAVAQAELRGAGATFPAKLYQRWGRQYAQSGGQVVNYKPTGSGDGLRQAVARSVDFACVDTPVSAQELTKRRLVQIPTCVGGLVPVVQGFENQKLKLTGELLADIMLGDVERWNDPRIAAVNKNLPLPNRRIVRVVRSDKSGSTESVTRYLAQQSSRFATDVGSSALPKWPGEVVAAEGTDGIAQAVKATPGAIGFVSSDRVDADGLAGVQLRNRDGQFVSASEAGFRAAVLNSELARSGQDTASLLDMPGADAWPLTQTTFVLLDALPATAASVEPALKFWYWCFSRGDNLTKGTGFAPLPTSMQTKLAGRFAQVRPQSGDLPRYQLL